MPPLLSEFCAGFHQRGGLFQIKSRKCGAAGKVKPVKDGIRQIIY